MVKKSGKAIEISDSMREAAKNIFDAVEQRLSGPPLDKYELIYECEITSKYGFQSQIEVMIAPRNLFPGRVGAFASPIEVTKALNTPYTKGILYLYTDHKSFYENPAMFRSTILHELVHAVDPKLFKENLYNKKWHRNWNDRTPSLNSEEINKKYLKIPWEQDAFMAQLSESFIKLISLANYTKEQAIDTVRNKVPSFGIENEWYKDPKIWRKYINTLYNAVQNYFSSPQS